MKLAILDDYQNAALGSADWDSLGADVEITVFDAHLGHDEARIADALAYREAVEAIAAWRGDQPVRVLNAG